MSSIGDADELGATVSVTQPSVAIVVARRRDGHDGEFSDTLDAISHARKRLDSLGANVRTVVDDGGPQQLSSDAHLGAPASDALAFLGGGDDYVITVDDNEPDPYGRILALYEARDVANIVIAARTSLDRSTRPKDLASEVDRLASRLTARLLTLDVVDVRSTTRLYSRAVLGDLAESGCDFDDAVGILVNATVRGWKLREIDRPFWPSHNLPASVARPTISSLRRYWSARNGIHDADYDMRAFNSRIPVQRRWQQQRHALTTDLVRPYAKGRILNVGCGSARMNLDLPGAFGVDVVLPKLRFLRHYGVNHLAQASVYDLPFADGRFDCVVCAEVIEHIPKDGAPIGELVRVLSPRGRLVISTPDYGTPVWPAIEKLYGFMQPSGYADEHVTHYTEKTLVGELAQYGLSCVAMRRLYGAILIGAFEPTR